MKHNEITSRIIECSIEIHRQLGPGLLESVYQRILAHELTKCGLRIAVEMEIPITWDELTFEVGFRADLLVNDLVIVELKSVETVRPVHKKQLLTYLKLSNKQVGLLINFNEELLKNGITRIVNDFKDE